MIEDEELLNEFLIESFENLDRLDHDFLELEREPGSREILASIFRTIHTIKGTCGFLGFSRLESVAHVGETLLGKLRDGLLAVNADITSTLLTMVDAIRTMLQNIEGSGAEGEEDYAELVAKLTLLYNGESLDQLAQLPPEELPAPPSPVAVDAPEIMRSRLGGMLVDAGLCTAESVIEALRAQEGGDRRRLGEILVAKGHLSVNQVLEVMGEREERHAEEVQKVRLGAATIPPVNEHGPMRSVADSSVRVDVALLDGLIDLVGELVLARNQLVQLTGMSASKDNTAGTAAQRVSHITSELQERVMKTRMQPVNAVWGKLPRVVRDLSVSCGKQVRVEMEGQDVELDKTIVEAIKDPLTHLVRNSVDHGIESPEVRLENGKPAEGVLSLRAFHEGGKVIMEITDDGGGIDPDKVKRKALERNIITADQAEAMSEQEAINLIFLPGFSTAEKVTNVSGRGVGMDVVKTNIEKIGGSLDVHSKLGRGTTLIIRIPLTLAIIPALVVTVRDARYAVPQTNLVELVRLKNGAEGLEMIEGSMFYRLRGSLLPAIDLGVQLGLNAETTVSDEDPRSARKRRGRSLAVLQVDGRQFGLIVDRVNDAEEIVVKPLGRHLKGTPLFAGCTIMGDGSVALILDVVSLAESARIGRHSDQMDASHETVDEDTETLLLCKVGTTRVAMPLSKVARLEKVDASSVEYAGRNEVLKYGKSLLPIVRLSNMLGGGYAEDTEKLVLVVSTEDDGRSVGMVVDAIVETTDVSVSSISLQGSGDRYGVLGTAVIRDNITDVINVDSVVATIEQSFFEPTRLELTALAS
ncbi:MAG: chemotaxis protein CheW [Acidimicrobiia bacterium]